MTVGSRLRSRIIAFAHLVPLADSAMDGVLVPGAPDNRIEADWQFEASPAGLFPPVEKSYTPWPQHQRASEPTSGAEPPQRPAELGEDYSH